MLVFGAMADKDVGGLARELFPLADEIVLTQPRVSRAASPDEIARRVGRLAARAVLRAGVVAFALRAGAFALPDALLRVLARVAVFARLRVDLAMALSV